MPGPFASRDEVFILRREGSGVRRIRFDVKKAAAGKGKQEPLVLQPGDIVVVP